MARAENRWSRVIGNLSLYAVALWAAYEGGWWGVFMVAIVCASDFVSDRWIYWHRQLDEAKRKRQQPPDGMITITLANGHPVFVPPTPELIEATRRIVAIVEGTDG